MTETECLEVVWMMLMLCSYLYGTKFSMRRNNDAVWWTLGPADAYGWLGRWRLIVLEFEYDVQYRPGVKHNFANAMSSLNKTRLENASVEDDISCFTTQLVEDGQQQDSKLGTFLDEKKAFHKVFVADDLSEEVFALGEDEYAPITKEEFLQEQATDRYCKTLLLFAGRKDTQLEMDHEVYLVKPSTLDNLLQKVVPESHRQWVLHLCPLATVFRSPSWY